jgi:prolyl-tRNA synthetase
MQTVRKYEIYPKEEDHARWYQTVLTTSDMIDYSTVSGCYVLKPLSLQLWSAIQNYLDVSIKDLGVENCYFPMFVTKSNLEKEQSHFSDFTPEVAWIMTDDSTVNDLAKVDSEIDDLVKKLKSKGLDVHLRTNTSERYAIRPTSETIIYPHFASWIKKNGKYPKINQWANVVRWETKATQPFIRSREFLWQEGHTCHQNESLAMNEVYKVLKMYKNTYEKLLAVPVISGIKSKSETFPGADLTTTIEGFLPESGKGIQAATSHYLGERFSKMFNVRGPDGEYVKQNSWGLTTRSIGVMVMTHSDNRGLVLPPNVAPIQVVLIACGLTTKMPESDKKTITDFLTNFCQNLNESGIRSVFDRELGETPGMKFNKWEAFGVPLRIEFGPKNLAKNELVLVRRDKPLKSAESRDIYKYDILTPKITESFITNKLENIQNDMFSIALTKLYSSIIYCSDNKGNNDREKIIKVLQNKKLALIDWKKSYENDNDNNNNDNNDDDFKESSLIQRLPTMEEDLKQLCKDSEINSTKVLCILSEEEVERMVEFKVIGIPKKGSKYALFGRSY